MRTERHYHPESRQIRVACSLPFVLRMSERKSVLEMSGEFCREAAVLTAVFIPLDLVLIDRPLTLGWIVAILGISGGLLAIGIACERWRP